MLAQTVLIISDFKRKSNNNDLETETSNKNGRSVIKSELQIKNKPCVRLICGQLIIALSEKDIICDFYRT